MFAETLWITAWGVGLTFFAMGIVVVSMVVLTKLAVPRRSSVQDTAQPEIAPGDDEVEGIRVAAAAAVALAQAEADRRPSAISRGPRTERGGALWQSYTRAQKLDQRKVHQALR